MPLAGLWSPQLGQRLSLDEAPWALEDAGIMPAEVVAAIIRGEDAPHRLGPFLSPSQASPDTTCRREVAIKKYVEYYLDPLTLWEAQEGSAWHRALSIAGRLDGIDYEVEVPTAALIAQGGNITPDSHGALRAEIFPGIFMHGTIDMLDRQRFVLRDIKTTRYPKEVKKRNPETGEVEFAPADYGCKDEWVLQTNLYRRLLEVVYGMALKEIWVWRIYRGSWNRRYTFRKFAIPQVPNDKLEAHIGEHCRSSQQFFELIEKAPTPEARLAALDAVPMDGEKRGMFNNKKCSMYCSVRNECWRLAGRPTLED